MRVQIIFKTSITEDFFFDTYNVFGGILSLLFQKDLIPISRNEFQALKKEILIVLKLENSLRYNKEALSRKFKFGSQEAIFHLERLERMGFVKEFDNFQFFILTERSYYIKVGLEKDESIIDNKDIDISIELLYVFLSLNKMNA